MLLQDEFRTWSLSLLKDPLFLQITPLAILVLFPLLVLLSVRALSNLGSSSSLSAWWLTMVFESFNFSFPWSWSSNRPSSAPSHETKKLKKKLVRTRGEEIELNGHAIPRMSLPPYDIPITYRYSLIDHKNEIHDGYYPGLVNISGTYCFMNSTLQVKYSVQQQSYYNSSHHCN